jgi:hypothetical protein
MAIVLLFSACNVNCIGVDTSAPCMLRIHTNYLYWSQIHAAFDAVGQLASSTADPEGFERSSTDIPGQFKSLHEACLVVDALVRLLLPILMLMYYCQI